MHDQKLTDFEQRCLAARNILVIISATLFIVSILPIEPIEAVHHDISGIAYLFGAGAYIAEIIEMSDEEKRAHPHHKHRVFMPNVFGILYIILGIAHIIE